jgi:hypothetical protein
MQSIIGEHWPLKLALLLALLSFSAWTASQDSKQVASGQVQIPNRSSALPG